MLAQSAANRAVFYPDLQNFLGNKTLSDHLSLTVFFNINQKWGNKPEGKSNKTSATFSLFSSMSVLPYNFKFVSIYS